MAFNVTVLGANSQVVTVPYNTQSNAVIAQQLANAINAGVLGSSIVPADNATYGPNPPTVPGGLQGEYVISVAPGVVTLPDRYTVAVVTAPSAVVTGSGATDESILSGANTDLTFNAPAGSGTIAAGGGDNQINLTGSGDGKWQVYTDSGNDIVYALNAGDDTISAGLGSNFIQLGSGNDQVISTGSDVIIGGTGNATVDGVSGSNVVYTGGGGNLTFVGNGSSAATIIGGSGSVTFQGGTGSNFVQGGSAGDNMLKAGLGMATLFGGGTGDVLTAQGSMSQYLAAGPGNETLLGSGSTGADTLQAGSGSDVITAGTGANTIVGGSGMATINGFLGSSDVFQFFKDPSGSGAESVGGTLFSVNQITINLQNFGSNGENYALNHQSNTPGGLSVTLSDGTTILFTNVHSGQLTSGNFS